MKRTMLFGTGLQKTIVVIFCGLLLAGCAGTKYIYKYKLEKPVAGGMHFNDGIIDATFNIKQKWISFVLQNKGAEIIKVHWDETVLVLDKRSMPVIHKGMKYIDREKSQTPNVIPIGAQLDDLIIPKEAIYYDSYIEKDWKIKDIFPASDNNSILEPAVAVGSKGNTLDLLLQLEVGGVRKDYMFTFIITDIVPK